MWMLRQRRVSYKVGDAQDVQEIKVGLPPAMAVFLPTVTVTAVAAITIFPVGTTAQLEEQHHHHEIGRIKATGGMHIFTNVPMRTHMQEHPHAQKGEIKGLFPRAGQVSWTLVNNSGDGDSWGGGNMWQTDGFGLSRPSLGKNPPFVRICSLGAEVSEWSTMKAFRQRADRQRLPWQQLFVLWGELKKPASTWTRECGVWGRGCGRETSACGETTVPCLEVRGLGVTARAESKRKHAGKKSKVFRYPPPHPPPSVSTLPPPPGAAPLLHPRRRYSQPHSPCICLKTTSCVSQQATTHTTLCTLALECFSPRDGVKC